ncbi:MAG: DUF1134 domain-containing protein [Gammaproteobacteria bacterium]|jgi:hypothetical protein|nr:DUF1134 domain-containing protein [Gammaproteobacteria bacterium]
MTPKKFPAWLSALVLGLTLLAGASVPGSALAQDEGAGEPTAADVAEGQPGGDVPQETYSQEETLAAAQKFFGGTTSGLAKAIEKAFSDLGRPVGYIIGNEGSGAFVVGLRYGEGELVYKGGGASKVYWQGPSVGFDFGGNASKVFTLVYDLRWTKDLYQRFPGVDGSLYVVAGVGLNYQRANGITLAPIRTGVGLRAGANVGYLAYTREKRINPF